MSAYFLPKVQGVGQAHPVLHQVPVVSAVGTDLDLHYGNLGRCPVTNSQLILSEFLSGSRLGPPIFAHRFGELGHRLPKDQNPVRE